MAEFNLEQSIKSGVEKALNKPIMNGKSITQWAAIGMKSPRWISVKDRLPEDTAKGRLYLVVNNGNVDVGIFHYGLWLLPTNNVNVSHWMPFPEAPKEGEGN